MPKFFRVEKNPINPPRPDYIFIFDWGAGMFATYIGVVGLYALCKREGKKPAIDLCQGYYLDKSRGANWWDQYFEGREPSPPCPHDWAIHAQYMAHRCYNIGATLKDRQFQQIHESIKWKPQITHKINKFYEENMATHYVVGVQYRGTDKVTEGAVLFPPSLAAQQVDDHIRHTGRKDWKVFVATDEQGFLDGMRERYGDRLLAYDAIRSTNGAPVHCPSTRADPYKKGEDALIDCALLTRCQMLFKTVSNLSLAACLINPDLPSVDLTDIAKGQGRG